MLAPAADDPFEELPIEADEAPAELLSDDSPSFKGTLRVPRPASFPLPPRPRGRDALALAMHRLDRGAPHRGALAALLGAIVRALPPRPVGRVDPAETETLRALDVVDELLDDDTPFPDPALYPTFLTWRALLLTRLDNCPAAAVGEACTEARRRSPRARATLDDALAEYHLRAGRWAEALVSWGELVDRDDDSVRRWRYALAAVGAREVDRAATVLRQLGVPVSRGSDGRPRGMDLSTIRVTWDRRARLAGLGRPEPRAHPVELVVRPIGPLHGRVLTAPEHLPVGTGDVLAWDRAMGGVGPDRHTFPLVARLEGPA